MRGLVAGLESPHPMALTMPALYQGDDFAQRLVGALDESLAPVFTSLDCLDAYLDPRLTPGDFLGWLARWVGVALDENWPQERQRTLVQAMVGLYGLRGTVQGLRQLLAITTGVEVEVADSGGATWSPVPGGALPGSPRPRLVVRIPPGVADLASIERLVAEAKPAHVPHAVEEVGS